MDIQEKNFINILSSYLNGTNFVPSENIQWNKIYELSKLHNLTLAVYMALNNSNVQINSEISEKFRADFLLGIKYSVMFYILIFLLCCLDITMFDNLGLTIPIKSVHILLFQIVSAYLVYLVGALLKKYNDILNKKIQSF